MLIAANGENTFEGAVVFLNDEKYFVYKANKKSLYIGKTSYREVMSRKDNFPKGTTFKKFMSLVHGEMKKYDDFEISEEDVNRKTSFEKINSLRKLQKTLMSRDLEKKVDELFMKYRKGKGGYNSPIESVSTRVIVVLFDDSKWAVLNINGKQYLYDLLTRLYIPFDNSIHKNGKEVVFPNRDTFNNELKKAV